MLIKFPFLQIEFYINFTVKVSFSGKLTNFPVNLYVNVTITVKVHEYYGKF